MARHTISPPAGGEAYWIIIIGVCSVLVVTRKKTCGFGATFGFGGDIPLFFGFGGDSFNALLVVTKKHLLLVVTSTARFAVRDPEAAAQKEPHLVVTKQFRNFASVLRSRSSDQGSSHMPPLPYCSALGSPG